MFEKVTNCRVCQSQILEKLLDLGNFHLSGTFPTSKNQVIEKGPLSLLLCGDCGLVQLAHQYDMEKLFGDNYGYRSGLNSQMVGHLNDFVDEVLKKEELTPEDLIVDIGSNDGTLLSRFPTSFKSLVGVDPTGPKFKKYYPKHIKLIPEFFSAGKFGEEKAKLITSFSMFYDLADPLNFMKEVSEILDDDGIWVMEQSYLPLMIKNNAYDCICHEHQEYYCLSQIKYMAFKVGLNILDVSFNNTNGGSIRVSLGKRNGEKKDLVNSILNKEKRFRYISTYRFFINNLKNNKKNLVNLLSHLKNKGKKVVGLGASTKGNITLQYCGIDESLLSRIFEVNEYKFNRFTPGTNIPISAEKDFDSADYKLVLPWHLKESFIESEKDFLKKGGKLIFPLPHLEIIGH
ncbi:MAG: methyltransferase domain-containing protein [Deltaproteobacteria bacterium]|nr:MAG: methyltransferase domain-containing protein [Deltaproteobacteria bacterium]